MFYREFRVKIQCHIFKEIFRIIDSLGNRPCHIMIGQQPRTLFGQTALKIIDFYMLIMLLLVNRSLSLSLKRLVRPKGIGYFNVFPQIIVGIGNRTGDVMIGKLARMICGQTALNSGLPQRNSLYGNDGHNLDSAFVPK